MFETICHFRIAWILTVLCVISVFTYALTTRLIHLYSYPTDIDLAIGYWERVPFPAVTICNQNQYRLVFYGYSLLFCVQPYYVKYIIFAPVCLLCKILAFMTSSQENIISCTILNPKVNYHVNELYHGDNLTEKQI